MRVFTWRRYPLYIVYWAMEDYHKTLTEFEARFSTEGSCRDYLFQLRWPTTLWSWKSMVRKYVFVSMRWLLEETGFLWDVSAKTNRLIMESICGLWAIIFERAPPSTPSRLRRSCCNEQGMQNIWCRYNELQISVKGGKNAKRYVKERSLKGDR